MDGENTLLFASDYPHWDYDDLKSLHLPPEWKPKILGQNALEVYKRITAPAKTRRLEDSMAEKFSYAVLMKLPQAFRGS